MNALTPQFVSAFIIAGHLPPGVVNGTNGPNAAKAVVSAAEALAEMISPTQAPAAPADKKPAV